MKNFYVDYNQNSKKFEAIKNLYYARKYKEYIIKSTEVLDKYPNEAPIRMLRSASYRWLGMHEQSISDLKYLLSNEVNPIVLAELYFMYYKLRMYTEALQLQELVYKTNCISTGKASFCEYVMRVNLGLKVNTKVKDYNRKQVISYDRDETISRLERRKECDKASSQFAKGVDVAFLYYKVSEDIINLEPLFTYDSVDVYCFSIPNIGIKQDGSVCNFIKVFAIPGTKNVLDICPINDTHRHNEINYLSCDIDLLFGRRCKTRVLSQIDKFNKRYGKV